MKSTTSSQLLSLPDNADGDQKLRHRSTGLPLNPGMVKKARELEMEYVEELLQITSFLSSATAYSSAPFVGTMAAPF